MRSHIERLTASRGFLVLVGGRRFEVIFRADGDPIVFGFRTSQYGIQQRYGAWGRNRDEAIKLALALMNTDAADCAGT